MFSSMTSSRRLAEECLKDVPPDDVYTDTTQEFVGLVTFADTIEAGEFLLS